MRVLLAVDGSESSQAAVDAVRERCWPEGTVVRVLSVAERVYPPPPAPFQLGLGMPPAQPVRGIRDMQDEQLRQAGLIAERAADQLAPARFAVETESTSGDPRKAIVDKAVEWRADLVILGSHGRTGFRRWLLGSVAESVVRNAPCSVEVARARGA